MCMYCICRPPRMRELFMGVNQVHIWAAQYMKGPRMQFDSCLWLLRFSTNTKTTFDQGLCLSLRHCD
jgi:hypothetical protein